MPEAQPIATLDLEISQSPDEVFERLYGHKLPAHGLVHVAAVTRREGVSRVLRIQGNTPKSAIDWYVLNAVRAWADVVLTSGKILREEPDLSYEISGPTEAARDSLRRWRGQRPPLQVAILSSGRATAAPLEEWQGSARPILFTSRKGARQFEDEGGTADVEAVATPSPRSLAVWASTLSSEPIAGRPARVSVELGPSTSKALYENPNLVDQLLLSEVQGDVPDDVLGGEFLPGFELERAFDSGPKVFADGRWVFRSFLRRE